MSEQKFDFRDKLEGWIDGVVDVFQMYLWTVFQLHVRPDIGMRKLTSEAELDGISRPAIYFVLSYFFMCFLIRDVDFSNPMFSVNIADNLDAIGVLDAAKTVKLETVIISVFPAIATLVFFVIVATTLLRVFGDDLDPALLRRNYCFALGGVFLMIGSVCGGFHYIVKPIEAKSWLAGLPIHILTMWPISSTIYAMLSIQYIGRPPKERLLLRWVAIMIPLLGVGLFFRLSFGSFYLLDYLRLR